MYLKSVVMHCIMFCLIVLFLCKAAHNLWMRNGASVQAPNPVALTVFSGVILPLSIVFKASNRGMTQKVMIFGAKLFRCW